MIEYDEQISTIELLEKRVEVLTSENKRLEEALLEVNKKYNALSNSKLGKLTNYGWKLRRKISGNSHWLPKGGSVHGKSLLMFRFSDYPFKDFLNNGDMTSALDIIEKGLQTHPKQATLQTYRQICLDKLDLLHSTSYFEHLIVSSEAPMMPLDGGKILHVLNTSMPYLNNGYSIRSSCILDNQRHLGMDVAVVTRPGYPNDFGKDFLDVSKALIPERHEGCDYYRLHPSVFLRYTPTKDYIDTFAEGIIEVARKIGSKVIHASSNYTIGLAALKAARTLGLPMVYEIRGFWEMTTVSKYPAFEGSEEYQMSQKAETFLAQQADQVVAISNGLKQELISRGIEASKITIIPNGVDLSKFQPQEQNQSLVRSIGTENNFVIGYIGSIVKYEGIQTVIHAMKQLIDQGIKDIKYVVVGDGHYKPSLVSLVKELNIEDHVIFTGRIPHDQVSQYYALFDLCVYFREYEKVTELVTPLKPLEAMASGKLVIGSDLGAIKEMVIDGVNGYIVPGDVLELADKIKSIIDNKEEEMAFGRISREWVVQHRSWLELAKLYEEVYRF